MSDPFLDATDADSFDTAAPDPEAVARIYTKLRQRARADQPGFDQLHPAERALLILVFGLLLERLRREGAI